MEWNFLCNFGIGHYEGTLMWNSFKFGLVVQELSFKDFSIFISGSHFVQRSRTICEILIDGIIFVWFDSLCPINNLSVIKGRVFLGWTSTKLGFMFLLKDTTQWRWWGSNPQPLGLKSSNEPLRSLRWHYGKHSCDNILNLDQLFGRILFEENGLQTTDEDRTQ